MTDAEIIKALECCTNTHLYTCDDCPFHKKCESDEDVLRYALDLINRQKAENERLLNLAIRMHTWIFLHTDDEAEAYKECGLSDEDNTLLGYGGKVEIERAGEE